MALAIGATVDLPAVAIRGLNSQVDVAHWIRLIPVAIRKMPWGFRLAPGKGIRHTVDMSIVFRRIAAEAVIHAISPLSEQSSLQTPVR